MIKINLLPKDLQQAARTPVKLFATFIGGVVVTLLCACFYGYLWFNTVVLEERMERKREEVEHLRSTASEVDSLLDDIEDYKERERAIISIKTNRILWSKKLDELVSMTPPHIWIIRLGMQELDPAEYKWEKGKEQTGGHLRLKCYSSGNQVARMTNFRQRLKNVDEFYLKFIDEKIKPENFYADFINISHPEWKFVVLEGFKDPNNIKFSVRLDLRPLVEKKKESKA
jgi:Tfp pilus assembly protein PilN